MSLCMLVPPADDEAALGPEGQQQGPSSQDPVGLQNANSTPLAPIFTWIIEAQLGGKPVKIPDMVANRSQVNL